MKEGNTHIPKKRFVERRRHKRHQLKKEAYAVLSPDYATMGKIIDISKGGLAYFCSETPVQDEIDIFCPATEYTIEKIKVNVVSSIELKTIENGKYTQKRRCSLQFVLLTKGQEAALEYFFQNYTDAEIQVHSLQ